LLKIEDRYLPVPGGEVFTRSWEPASAVEPALLLLHDSLGCVELWRNFPQALATKLNRRVIAYDRLGFGKSTARKALPSASFIQEEAELYLPSILSQLKIEGAGLFGYSVGGAMALSFAARQQCAFVVSESTQAFVEERTCEGIREAKKSFTEAERFEKLKKYHGDKSEWVLKAWTELWLSPAFETWTLAAILPAVCCPVLALHGDQDEYGSLQFPQMIGIQVSGPSQVEIFQNCGHMPHREREAEVLNLAKDFVDRWI
jgi:pimeloyl-ACP methyl ester carboxylesterase